MQAVMWVEEFGTALGTVLAWAGMPLTYAEKVIISITMNSEPSSAIPFL